MKETIISILRESADLKLKFAKESFDTIIEAKEIIEKCFKGGGKVLIFGNGGSAADSQHIASEFVNKYSVDRKPLSVIALTTDTSVLTSVSNDRSYEDIFSRQIEAIGNKNDLAWGLTTSGKSKNIIKGLETAKSRGMKTLAFTGQTAKKIKTIADCVVSVPSKTTGRIQEVHLTTAHIICELIERSMESR